MKSILVKTSLVLGVFAMAGTTLMFLTYEHSQPFIKVNEERAMLRALSFVLPASQFDNDIVNDVVMVSNTDLLGSDKPMPVYRARQRGEPAAVVLTTIAPDGYGGPIKLLVGIDYDGVILGVRVIAHRETPGLGDGFDPAKSDWIESFTGKSLRNTADSGWRVKKDGGVFDQFTGATISPRAIVRAVHRAIVFYRDKRGELFHKTEQQH